MTKDLTHGNPMGLILSFGVPLFFGYLFQQLYNVVDTAIVGKTLGGAALAAVGATSSINFLVVGFCTGVCSGLSIPVARALRRQAGTRSAPLCHRRDLVVCAVLLSPLPGQHHPFSHSGHGLFPLGHLRWALGNGGPRGHQLSGPLFWIHRRLFCLPCSLDFCRYLSDFCLPALSQAMTGLCGHSHSTTNITPAVLPMK